MSDPHRPEDVKEPVASDEPVAAGSSGGVTSAATDPVAGEVPKEHRTWGMVAHLAALAGLTPVPGANLLGPLVVWLVKKDEMPFVDDQGKESLNFQITVFLALLIASPTVCIGVGFFLLPLIGLAGLILAIVGAIKANEGVAYRYPFTLRLIK